MFVGNRTPDDLTYIDSTDNDTVRAVKSAWNLNRYGTSWPEILKLVEQEDKDKKEDKDTLADKDTYVDDSLQYLLNQENWDDEECELWSGEDPRNHYLYKEYFIPSVRGPYYIRGQSYWPSTERAYFDYLDSIAEHPLDDGTRSDFDINKRARAYQYWKAMKYGK